MTRRSNVGSDDPAVPASLTTSTSTATNTDSKAMERRSRSTFKSSRCTRQAGQPRHLSQARSGQIYIFLNRPAVTSVSD